MFTRRTIKHSLQNTVIWPVSVMAVKKKLREYGKKTVEANSLEILEYDSESDSANKEKLRPAPDL